MAPRAAMLALAAGALLAPAARAQQRPDTAVIVFNEILAPRELAFVVLSQGIAYRVEVFPRAATIEIRSLRPGPPPLSFRPLRNPAEVEGGASYLIVPSVSEEYRVVVVAGVNEPVRIRIEQDPRETRILAGQGRTPRGLMTLGVRAVALPARFETTRSDSAIMGTAVGGEACLGVGAGRFHELPQLGGCLFTVGYYSHSGGAGLVLVGTNPHYVVSRPGAPLQIGIAVNFAFGKAGGPFRRDVMYLVLGAGPAFSWRPAAWLTLELAPGLSLVQRGGYTLPPGGFSAQPTDVASATALVPRLAATLHMGL